MPIRSDERPGEAARGTGDDCRRRAAQGNDSHPLLPPYPSDLQIADFGLGCFWGAERRFWQAPGVRTTLVGYQGGHASSVIPRALDQLRQQPAVASGEVPGLLERLAEAPDPR